MWQVNTVVIATNPAAPHLQQGSDPVYAAAFMTAALGRLPTLQAGAWVWDDVELALRAPLHLRAGTLASCVAAAEAHGGRETLSQRAPACVASAASALARG